MAYYKWYLTDVTVNPATNVWTPTSTSIELDVWFGTAPPPDPSLYDVVITDSNADGLITSAEIRTAIAAHDPTLDRNPAQVGSDFGTTTGFTTIIFSDPAASIEVALKGVVLTDDPLNDSYTVAYKPGTGNFNPINPGNLEPEPPEPDGVVDGTLDDDLIDLNYCLLYTSPSPRDKRQSRMPSSA